MEVEEEEDDGDGCGVRCCWCWCVGGWDVGKAVECGVLVFVVCGLA